MRIILNWLATVERIWLTTWIVIYVCFLILDAVWPGAPIVTFLKYSGIVLCVVYVYQKHRSDVFLELALAFTLLADTILVIDSTSIIGVFVFCIAQFFHLTRLSGLGTLALANYVIIVLAIFFFGVLTNFLPMFAIAFVYGLTLCTNFILARRWYREAKNLPSVCATTGFGLFLCCDFCVACSYLSLIGILAPQIYGLANYFSWFFYYPSQVLVANSSKPKLIKH